MFRINNLPLVVSHCRVHSKLPVRFHSHKCIQSVHASNVLTDALQWRSYDLKKKRYSHPLWKYFEYQTAEKNQTRCKLCREVTNFSLAEKLPSLEHVKINHPEFFTLLKKEIIIFGEKKLCVPLKVSSAQ